MSRVLLPVAILEGETVDPGLIDLFADDEVVLLGYHQIPEQTAPEQARDSFGERANAKLEDVETALADAGATVERRLVFTHDPDQTKERVAADEDCDAVVTAGPSMQMDRLLVVVHPAAQAADIASFAAEQVADSDREVVLLSLTPDEDAARESLDTAREVLADAGVTGSRVTVEERVVDNHVEAIVEAATGCDAVVVGQREPSAMELVFGEFVERVKTETVGPVIVVRTKTAATGED